MKYILAAVVLIVGLMMMVAWGFALYAAFKISSQHTQLTRLDYPSFYRFFEPEE